MHILKKNLSILITFQVYFLNLVFINYMLMTSESKCIRSYGN